MSRQYTIDVNYLLIGFKSKCKPNWTLTRGTRIDLFFGNMANSLIDLLLNICGKQILYCTYPLDNVHIQNRII